MSTDDEHMEGGCIVYAADAHEDSDNDVFFSADEDVAVEEHQAVACKSVSKSKPKTVSEKYKKAVDNEVASSATSSGGILSDDCGMGSGNTDDDDDDALPHVIFDTSKMARERGQPLQLEFEELTTIRTAHDETGAAAESMVRAGPVIPLSMAITHPEIPRSTMPNNNETYGSDGTVHDIANESNDCVSNNSNSDDEAARLFGALCLEDLPTFDLTGVDDDVCKHVMNDDDADDEEEALIRWTRRPRAQARIVVESESDEEDDAGAKNNNVLYVKKTYGTVIALDEDFEDGDDNELESVGISGDKNSAAPPLLAADEPWLSDDDCAVVNATPVHITKPGPAVIFTPDFSRRPLHNIASTNVPSTATPGKHVRTPNVALAPVTPGRAAATQKRAFQSQKRSLAEQLLGEFNRVVFGGKLPPLTLNWSQTLNKTAGRAHCTAIGPAGAIEVEADSGDENSKNVTVKPSSVAAESSTRTYRVELSTKVIDDEQRLRMTLAHELCHIAVWHLHGLDHPPHGKLFMGYGARFSRHYDDIVVTRLHSYDIAFKYQYVCTNADGCGKVYGRHSKSIDVARKCCGVCRGRLELATKTKADGTPLKANPYREFVKANFGVVREELQSRMSSSTGARKIAHGEVMSELAQRWRAFKMSNGTAL